MGMSRKGLGLQNLINEGSNLWKQVLLKADCQIIFNVDFMFSSKRLKSIKFL